MSNANRQDEIDQNLAFFLAQLPGLPAAANGKFALLRHQTIVEYYDTIVDALKVANATYPDRLFSIQQVTEAATDLGYYSHAKPLMTA